MTNVNKLQLSLFPCIQAEAKVDIGKKIINFNTQLYRILLKKALPCHNVFCPFISSSFFLNYLFIYLWLCWVFVSVRGLSLVVASGGHSSLRCAGLALSWPLLLRSTGSRHAGSVVVAHGPSRSAACGIFPDQGSNLYPLHWQADSQPLRHQGSPCPFISESYDTFHHSPVTVFSSAASALGLQEEAMLPTSAW